MLWVLSTTLTAVLLPGPEDPAMGEKRRSCHDAFTASDTTPMVSTRALVPAFWPTPTEPLRNITLLAVAAAV